MTQILEKPILLIDGSFYLYRAYHVFPLLKNKKGESTGAIYGILSMLHSLIIKFQPTHAAIVFDTQGKTFRDKIYTSYKSHRPLMPKALCEQIEPIYSLIKSIGLPLVTVSGVEADDVIGTLAKKVEKMGHSVLISTNDKDIAQLVTSNISMLSSRTNNILGPKEILIKYGVSPELIVDLLALTGDASDNIPGVPGVGEKTAKALLQTLGGLNELYNKLKTIASLKFRGAKTIAKKLEENREMAYLSYQLARIKTDVDMDFRLKQLEVQEPMTEEILKLFKQYEFNRWIESIAMKQWLRQKK